MRNYPEVSWSSFGLRPLQVGLVMTVIATSLAGILANPLFNLVNTAVLDVPQLANQPTAMAVAYQTLSPAGKS
ncbi:MAG: hypothetical protein KatS3mg067_0759 [Thermosynechococcus sp.]|nr:MAG: hypothetical protein KatS3mg067_0759 [Thermosynechococcus sp.]